MKLCLGLVSEKACFANSVILYLVKMGARVNEKDKYGLTPLHYAAMRGNTDATKELLSCKGVDIEVTAAEEEHSFSATQS